MITITYDKITKYEGGLPQKQIRDAVDMVNEKQMWIYLKDFVPKPDEGFVFTSDEKMRALMNAIDVNGTMSGLEMSVVMRLLQRIAKDNF